MPSVATTTTIHAPPSAVWAVLTDYAAYPEWNPFITALSGEKKVNGRLTATISPPDSKPMTFSPTILTFTPNQHLAWRGRLMGLPGLFTGDHHFVLATTEDGQGQGEGEGCRLEQSEEFTGVLAVLVGWLSPSMYDTTRKGFGLMNDALKARVEGGAGAGQAGQGVRQRGK